MWKKIRFLISVCLMVISITLLVWSFEPIKKQVDEQILQPTRMKVKFTGEEETALLENRRVRLEWPISLRIGEEGVVQLDFQQVDADGASTSQATGFTDAYTAHNIMLEAMFEVAGLKIFPPGTTRISLPAGQPASFTWKVNPPQAGMYPGTVWLSLRFLPLDGSAPIQVPVYVKDIQLHATSLLGLSEAAARLLGGVGVLVSLWLLFKDRIRMVIEGITDKTHQTERAK